MAKTKTASPSPKAFPLGSRVVVTDGGPFHGQEGEFVEIRPNGWTRLVLDDKSVPGRDVVRTTVIAREVEAVG